MSHNIPQAAAHADPALPRAIATCRRKLATKLPPRDVDRLARYLGELGKEGLRPPGRGRGFDWDKISVACALPPELIEAAKDDMLPALRLQARAGRRAQKARTKARSESPSVDQPKQRNARGRKPHAPVEFPTPHSEAWDDPPEFHRALTLHMNRHGDSSWRLHAAVRREDERFNYSTVLTWRRGQKAPQDALSFSILARIEHRYRLPAGYFTEKLKSAPRATRGAPVLDIAPSEMRRLAWHLPNDLRDRSLAEQEEIVSWVRNVIISGATDYRRYQAAAMKQRYGLRFATQLAPGRSAAIDLRADDLKAPRTLNSEMEALVAFKTSTLTTAGYARSGVWGPVTADQRTEHLSLLFGALMAPPDGPIRGCGIPSDKLTLALLLFPAVWDWYVQWRERRRGFYTSWEVDLLQLGVALAREKTGWLTEGAGARCIR